MGTVMLVVGISMMTTDDDIENNDDAVAKNSDLGFPMESTRGAQSPEEKPIG